MFVRLSVYNIYLVRQTNFQLTITNWSRCSLIILLLTFYTTNYIESSIFVSFLHYFSLCPQHPCIFTYKAVTPSTTLQLRSRHYSIHQYAVSAVTTLHTPPTTFALDTRRLLRHYNFVVNLYLTSCHLFHLYVHISVITRLRTCIRVFTMFY